MQHQLTTHNTKVNHKAMRLGCLQFKENYICVISPLVKVLLTGS